MGNRSKVRSKVQRWALLAALSMSQNAICSIQNEQNSPPQSRHFLRKRLPREQQREQVHLHNLRLA